MIFIEQFFRKSKKILSMGIILYFCKLDLISNPLTERDLIILAFLEKIWGRAPVARSMVRKLSKPDRYNLVLSADYSEAWERWVASRYRTHFEGNETNQYLTVKGIENVVKQHRPKLEGRDLSSRIRQIRDVELNAIKYQKRKRERKHNEDFLSPHLPEDQTVDQDEDDGQDND